MNSDFYQAKEFAYPEVGIVLEDFKYTSKGKIYIPILTPTMKGDKPIKEKKSKGSTSNIVNYNAKHGIKDCITSNYVELYVPTYIGYEIKNNKDMILKGTKFIISFIGGEVNDPKIIGLYI